MILLREKIKYDSSANKIYGILFDGAWLWEEYLATMLKAKGFIHPENKKGSGMIHPFTDKRSGRFYPDFYKTKPGIKLSDELADIILDAKYKNFDKSNPPADDIAQMISYIHVMDAREGAFVYPSRSKNEADETWTIRPFAGQTALLMTKPFFIPQDKESYSSFVKEIYNSEQLIIK